MKKILFMFLTLVWIVPCVVWAGGSKEAAGSSTRGSYLAERGEIIPPEEVYIDSYVAHVDYSYPLPDVDAVGIYLYSGHRQLSVKGQEEIIQIGIQAGKRDFEDLPPMNLAFVIDHSGSMASADKLNWVKDAFDIFIEQVRDVDYVSLVIFDQRAQVVFPATKMDSHGKRDRFRRAVQAIRPEGNTNIKDGLTLGCLEVVKNLNQEYTNRVMFLSDGCDTCGNSHESILEVARQFCEEGVTISTIGVGKSFDLELMVEMADTGGGSSRFISDREEMEKTFGSELDRMVVPVARNLDMRLEFLVDVDLIDTWGYENRRMGDTIRYFLPTLHHGDYETILAHIRVRAQRITGLMELARFSVRYEDVYGNEHRSGPHVLEASFVEAPHPVTGFTDGKVLHSGTMLHIAQNLKTIGELYHGHKTQKDLGRAFSLTQETKKELLNARLRLDNEGFDREIKILDRYIDTLGRELALSDTRIDQIKQDGELASPSPERSLQNNIRNLCQEIALDLRANGTSTLVFCGFVSGQKISPDLVELISESAVAQISPIRTVTMVPRRDVSVALRKHGYSPSDLTDKLNAVEVGRSLSADYVLTGSVIETVNTIIIFSRLLDVRSGEVDSAPQVIVAK
jgi:hypothetical protein